MKNRIFSMLVGIAFGLASSGASRAMSHLASMTIEPVTPISTLPGASVAYKITLTRTGQGVLNVDLTTSGLPNGVTASFSPALVRFTGRVPETLTANLTITCTSATHPEPCAFTVTGESRREILSATVQFVPPANLSASFPILTLDQPGPDGITIRGTGSSVATYQIEATPDLTNPSWSAIGSTTADNNGLFSFLDTHAKELPARFYRALLLGSN